MNRPLTARDRDMLIQRQRDYRASKMRRDHEVEMLLDAGVPLPEAIQVADAAMADRRTGSRARKAIRPVERPVLRLV